MRMNLTAWKVLAYLTGLVSLIIFNIMGYAAFSEPGMRSSPPFVFFAILAITTAVISVIGFAVVQTVPYLEEAIDAAFLRMTDRRLNKEEDTVGRLLRAVPDDQSHINGSHRR